MRHRAFFLFCGGVAPAATYVEGAAIKGLNASRIAFSRRIIDYITCSSVPSRIALIHMISKLWSVIRKVRYSLQS